MNHRTNSLNFKNCRRKAVSTYIRELRKIHNNMFQLSVSIIYTKTQSICSAQPFSYLKRSHNIRSPVSNSRRHQPHPDPDTSDFVFGMTLPAFLVPYPEVGILVDLLPGDRRYSNPLRIVALHRLFCDGRFCRLQRLGWRSLQHRPLLNLR
jgi:hypothetical protein